MKQAIIMLATALDADNSMFIKANSEENGEAKFVHFGDESSPRYQQVEEKYDLGSLQNEWQALEVAYHVDLVAKFNSLQNEEKIELVEKILLQQMEEGTIPADATLVDLQGVADDALEAFVLEFDPAIFIVAANQEVEKLVEPETEAASAIPGPVVEVESQDQGETAETTETTETQLTTTATASAVEAVDNGGLASAAEALKQIAVATAAVAQANQTAAEVNLQQAQTNNVTAQMLAKNSVKAADAEVV